MLCLIFTVQQSDSTVQQSDSAICIIIFILFSIMVYHRILDIVPCAI